jgi:hypothetical protein
VSGCGTKVSNPFDFNGVMIMQMINNTSKISISGTTFHFRNYTALARCRHGHGNSPAAPGTLGTQRVRGITLREAMLPN